MPDAPSTLYLLDTHSIIFQMFHGVGPMNAPDGRPTNAVYGVTRDLLNIHEEIQPTYLLCTFDLAGPTFRETIYPEYKKNRPPPPEDLITQVGIIHQVLEAMDLPILSQPNYEADDVMATIAAAAAARGIEVTICTSDKDCRQLIQERVRIYNLRKKIFLDRDAVVADWGVTPEQVVDFQTLVGDSVDNVPGVAGIGEKTAAKLLQQYGTLDNLVAHADEIKQPKMRENLKASIANGNLERSRQLVRLETNVPMTLDWDNWLRKPWDGPKLQAIFAELGFKGFANRVSNNLKSVGKAKNSELLSAIGVAPDLAKPLPSKSSKPAVQGQGELFGDPDVEENPFGVVVKKDTWKSDYRLVDTPSAWQAFLKDLQAQPRFAIDLETTGLDALQCAIVGFAFSWQAETGWYVPVLAPPENAKLDAKQVLAELKPILENPGIAKINQNIKYDQLVLRSHGIDLHGVVGDSMIAHYLLHAAERSHGLDELTRQYFAHENISIKELIGKGKKQKRMDEVPTDKVCAYAAEDADAAWRLASLLEQQLDQVPVLRTLYDTLEIPLIRVLAQLEATGIRLDVPYLQKLSIEMGKRLEQLELDIHGLAGKEFNIASLKQLRDVLYKDLSLPILKRTDLSNEPSTDQETLEKLAALGHEVPKKIIEHRQISKLKSTYVDALPVLVNPQTGRLHTSFNQTVAATGRLSSSEPNLQNIPARTDMGREIRQAFLPREGWQLLTADYSQIELRLLAHLSSDENLQKAYREGIDIHTQVAGEIFAVALPDVTSDMRRVAKTVNFGVIYGMSAHGLAERLLIDRGKADTFIEQYFARYPKVLKYQNALLKRCRKEGEVRSLLGRRRMFDPQAIRPGSTYQSRNQAEREAINMEIQASAADLMKLAMLNVQRRLEKERLTAKMLLSVHDELVFEVPPPEVVPLAALVQQEMTSAMALSVPLEVDVSVGSNWLDVDDLPTQPTKG